MYMVPMDLVFADSFELTEKSKVFMDYPTGNFYWRSDIVRVDRGRE